MRRPLTSISVACSFSLWLSSWILLSQLIDSLCLRSSQLEGACSLNVCIHHRSVYIKGSVVLKSLLWTDSLLFPSFGALLPLTYLTGSSGFFSEAFLTSTSNATLVLLVNTEERFDHFNCPFDCSWWHSSFEEQKRCHLKTLVSSSCSPLSCKTKACLPDVILFKVCERIQCKIYKWKIMIGRKSQAPMAVIAQSSLWTCPNLSWAAGLLSSQLTYSSRPHTFIINSEKYQTRQQQREIQSQLSSGAKLF